MFVILANLSKKETFKSTKDLSKTLAFFDERTNTDNNEYFELNNYVCSLSQKNTKSYSNSKGN